MTVVDGISVTGTARTILDLAMVLSRPQLERVMSEVEVLGLADRLSIPDLLGRYPGRRGSAVLRSLLDGEEASRGVTANDFEEAFAVLVDASGVPRPRFNADLSIRGRFIKPDAMWADEKVIVELDGRGSHGTALAFEKDRERDRLLLTEGWRVMRVTWRQLRDEPTEVIADLRWVLGVGSRSVR